jgi:3-methyladenine DNA glycosylase/8-oxoguanine DNA glycosylase
MVARALGEDVPNHRPAVRHLKAADPVMARVIARVGPCRLDPAQRPDVFHALVRAIIYQQLNGSAAGSIYRKFKGLYPRKRFPNAADIRKTPDGAIRGAGISPQKLSYLRDLSAKMEDGTLKLRRLHLMDDEAVVEHLTQVHGVGRWTAEMVLMFTLGRPDVLPVDDYGFKRAVQIAYKMRGPPKPERLEKLAEPWRPYRTVATWYMWQSLSTGK